MTTMTQSTTPAPHPAAARGGAVAALEGAVKRYGAVTALDHLDLEVHAGEILALLGPNGAGKTTAVSLLLGLRRPDAGTARLFGRDPRSPAARTRTGAMLQIAKVPDTLQVGEHIDLFASYYPAPLPRAEVVERAGLEGLEDRAFGVLSGGERQRLMFALALCGDPDLLFLDEPTVGLDVASRRSLWERIRELAEDGRTVLLTTHYLDEADALADRVVVLHGGRILAEGTPAAIKQRAGGRRIRCATRLPAAGVAGLPGVTRAARRGDLLEVFTSVAEPVVRELLARDPQLAELEVAGAGLEEAFLNLTADADREGAATPGEAA